MSLIETWKSVLHGDGCGGAVLKDLSMAFDMINYDLLLAKLCTYGFTSKSLRLIKSYLTNGWQRTKVNTSFSTSSELLLRVPQGSVLGPLLFNIYLNQCTNVCNYADSTTFHA